MLRIHKSTSKKIPIAIGTSICGAGALAGMYYLTYTPELSHAEAVMGSYDEKPTTTLLDATYMQELTSGMCERSVENESKQLIDTRDGKTYWVTKLRDNNCWMTQNLDLDIPADGLSAKDTDISEDWNAITNLEYPPIATQTGKPSGFGNSDRFDSYDPGEHYCINGKTGCQLESSLNEGHDAQGNYYSWNAATANSGVDLLGDEEAPYSICAKGWRLPRGKDVIIDDSFALLLNDTQPGDAILSPFYLLWGGYVSFSDIMSSGTIGYYWTSTTGSPSTIANNTKNNAYLLQLRSEDTLFSASTSRSLGASVRCVLRDSTIDDYGNNTTIKVNPTISLDVADEVKVEKSEVNPSTANLDVKVSSNQKYSVGISAEDSNLTSVTSGVKIPAKSGLLNTAENGWGIKLKDDTNYTALTTSLQTFYTASGAEIKTVPFTIGVSTAPDLPNGEYSTDITVTATQN